MLLVAQRVAGPGGDGYNAYRHRHGDIPGWGWTLPEGVPDQQPGEADGSAIEIRGPARVRSFLDLAFPDSQPFEAVNCWAYDALVSLVNAGSRLPISVAAGPWFARFEVEPGLVHEWHDELHRLLDHLRTVAV